METHLYGTAVCQGLPIRYYLLLQRGRDGCRQYGIRIEYKEEAATVMGLTVSGDETKALLQRLMMGTVTPVTVPDVIEDWLLK